MEKVINQERNILFNKNKTINSNVEINNSKKHIPSMEYISPINKKTNKNLIIMIRGHIRDSFNDSRLYNLISKLCEKYNVSIYLHTWNIMQSDKSWRNMELINTPITKEMIENYFKNQNIKCIKIEDETNIEIYGNTEGKISNTLCPILCWKNMWYGMEENIKDINESMETTILNIRYDIFTNKNRLFTIKSIISLIENNFNKYMYSNEFILKEPKIGIDNLILGSLYSMKKLIHHFHNNLDTILEKYPDEIHQEFIVFKENKLLK